jgi:hypothetical protein
MWHLGIDLHRHTVVIAAINDGGEVRPAVKFNCSEPGEIIGYCQQFRPYRAVIEATSTLSVAAYAVGRDRHGPAGPPVPTAGHGAASQQDGPTTRA